MSTQSSPAEEFPAILACADESSKRAQRQFLVITALGLALVAIAATMGAVGTRWSAWVGAGAFLCALVLGALAVTQNLERTWYDGRALAESAKSITWLYIVRGGPFATSEPDTDDTFKRRLRELHDELQALDFVLPSAGAEITPSMRALRESPLLTRRERYERDRLGDQIDYYRKRGHDHKQYALGFRLATGIAQAFGLVGAVLNATGVIDVDLLGVGAACAASLTAWLQARDHVTLARAYELTAQDLDRVREDGPPAGEERSWGEYVADAEAAMSREHVMWIARRGRLRRGSHAS